MGAGWDAWSANDILREIDNRMTYFYYQIDGSYNFPNSKEGDLLKMIKVYIEKLSTDSK